MDMLFWFRKFKIFKIPILLSPESQSRFFAKIDQYLDKNVYKFKNLATIYYDYSFINKNNEKLTK